MPEDRDQEDVLRKKGDVTKGDRGLQIWSGDAGAPEGQAGDASEGTAARAARITEAQLKKEKDKGRDD